MLSLLINILVVVTVVLGAVVSYRRGLLRTTTGLMSLLVGVGIAAVAYQWCGGQLAAATGMDAPLARVIMYAALVVAGQSVVIIGVFMAVKAYKKPLPSSRFTRPAAGAVGVIHALSIVGLTALLLVAAPISAHQRAVITNTTLIAPLVRVADTINAQIALTPGSDIGQIATLLTADPESSKTVDLGFTTTDVAVDTVDENRMLELINAERAKQGLRALSMNPAAQNVARAHSRDMLARGYFSHQTPEHRSPFDRMRAGGVMFGAAGENIALAPDLQIAHTGLMNSPPHRENILSSHYHTVGIGIVRSSRYGVMVTQDFTD